MTDDGDGLELSNEFAQVVLRRVRTRNGVRLEIRSPRLGRAARLCPLPLESLTCQDERTFSRFLETLYAITLALARLGATPPVVPPEDVAELPDLGAWLNVEMAWRSMAAGVDPA